MKIKRILSVALTILMILPLLVSCGGYKSSYDAVMEYNGLKLTEEFYYYWMSTYKRNILSNSGECELDKQGRILLSENLRNYASLKKEVTIIGVSSYIEIWDTEEWNKYNESSVGVVEGLAAYGL